MLLAEGFHLAEEALRAGASVEMAVVSPALEDSRAGLDLRESLGRRGVPVHEVAQGVLDDLQDARSPQPILLVVRRARSSLEAVLAAGPGTCLLAVAHGVQDPGNLGAMIRTADAAGATGFLSVGECADLYHPRTVRATMGSIFRLPVAETDADSLLETLRSRGILVVGADSAATAPYGSCDLRLPVAVFFGREGTGLPPEILGRMDRTARIPMAPGVDSLSVGAAAAVLLFEAARQRRG